MTQRQTITAETEIRDYWRPLETFRLFEIHDLEAKVRRRNRWIIGLVVALAMEAALVIGFWIDKSRWGW